MKLQHQIGQARAGLWRLWAILLIIMGALWGTWDLTYANQARNEHVRFIHSIASPLYESVEEALKGYSDGQVMLRNEVAFQIFNGGALSHPAIEKVRLTVNQFLSSCHSSLSNIRRLDSSTPDFEILAKRAVKALPALDDTRRDIDGNLRPEDKQRATEFAAEALVQIGGWLWDQYEASEERDRYRICSNQARRASLALKAIASAENHAPKPIIYGIGITFNTTKTDGLLITEIRDNSPAKTAGLTIGDKIVAINGAPITAENLVAHSQAIVGPKNTQVMIGFERAGERKEISILRSLAVYEAALLDVDINGSWNGFYSSDWVSFKNISGRDLTNVTLYVDLKGRHGKDGRTNGDTHLHYVNRWPAGAIRIARYMSSSASGIVRNVSVDQIDTLRYELYSSELRQEENVIPYTGVAYDEDVKQFCEKLSLFGSWRNFEPDHWLYNSGFLIQNRDEGHSFPVSHVTVRAHWGTTNIGYRWTMSDSVFPAGTSDAIPFARGRYFDHAAFNRGRPDRVEVVLEFPHTNYACEKMWDFSN